jgi:hypothetical protein
VRLPVSPFSLTRGDTALGEHRTLRTSKAGTPFETLQGSLRSRRHRGRLDAFVRVRGSAHRHPTFALARPSRPPQDRDLPTEHLREHRRSSGSIMVEQALTSIAGRWLAHPTSGAILRLQRPQMCDTCGLAQLLETVDRAAPYLFNVKSNASQSYQGAQICDAVLANILHVSSILFWIRSLAAILGMSPFAKTATVLSVPPSTAAVTGLRPTIARLTKTPIPPPHQV